MQIGSAHRLAILFRVILIGHPRQPRQKCGRRVHFFSCATETPPIAPSMDPFNFPAIGDPRAVGSKFGSSSGTSTDIIYPVSKQVDDAFQPGRTLELAWKSDQHRFFSPKNTRLMVEYELMFGEVDTTCADIVKGPEDSAGAPPSSSVRMTCMPNSTLFDSQVRFVANNTVVDGRAAALLFGRSRASTSLGLSGRGACHRRRGRSCGRTAPRLCT